MKNLKKLFVLSTLCFSFVMPIFSAEKFQDMVEEEIVKWFHLRMELALCETPEEAIQKLDERHDEILEKGRTLHFTDEEILVMDNFWVLERQNYMRDINRKDPELENIMMTQKKKNDAWFKQNKKAKHNKWLYCTTADIIGCSMTWMSVWEILRDGKNVKKYYERALKLDPYLSYGYTNLGQWHFYAPAIVGGSKKKMRLCFNTALEMAKNSAEKYFAQVFLSQVHFEDKKYDECQEMFDLAEAAVPGGSYVAKVKEMNREGYSVFAYNRRTDADERDVDTSMFVSAGSDSADDDDGKYFKLIEDEEK